MPPLHGNPTTTTWKLSFVVDPVGLGIVQSLARPGGNIIGFSSFDAPMVGKWVQLLKEAAPGVKRVAPLFNPDTAFAPPFFREMELASSFGVTVAPAPVHGGSEIERAAAEQAIFINGSPEVGQCGGGRLPHLRPLPAVLPDRYTGIAPHSRLNRLTEVTCARSGVANVGFRATRQIRRFG